MGFLDFLKDLFPPGENPLRGMEPQCIHYKWVTLRLPAGWRFAQADGRSFKVIGPGDCSVDCLFSGLLHDDHNIRARDFEKKYKKGIVQSTSKYFLESKSVRDEILPTGVLWLEATDLKGQTQQLRIALLNPRPQNMEWLPPVLLVTCMMPGTPNERFEVLRNALRSAEWN
jgi:hypothetical protein